MISAPAAAIAAITAGAEVGFEESADALGSPDKFDGSFIDQSLAEKCPEGCERTINAEGGFALINGRDSPKKKAWDTFATYDGKEIVIDMSSRKGPKRLVGKWNNKEKTIEWEDGTVWEKMPYKIQAAPFEVEQRAGQMRDIMLKNGEIESRR